jgi:RNA polymerase sigma-70 factor (ECF subfamily)
MTADDRLQSNVAAALAQDVDANFERLVTTYGDRVFAFVLNLVADRFIAEEIAQETFVAAYRALCGYEVPRRRALSIRAWLYTIALNRLRNRARTRGFGATLPLESVLATARSDERDEPAARAERSETAAALRAALARLALRYRTPVVLRHIDGRSYAEIGKILNQPVGTVKANVHRGLALLRADFETRDQYAN